MPASELNRQARWALVAAFALTVAVVGGRTRVHLCDGDAQLYRVVARNIVEGGGWLDLTYLPSVHPRFREHLPFGLWPTATAISLFGEAATVWLDGLWTLAILGVVAWLARRTMSTWAAAGSVLVLGTMDPFSMYCAFARLDGATALFSLLSAAPWLLGSPRWRGTALGALAAAAACAVKGPFGLVLLVVTSAARSVVDRSFRPLLLGGCATVLGVLPVAAFLLYQRQQGDGSWWEGYVGAQLQSSAEGSRSDGIFTPWYPFIAVSRHFWPGLLLVPFALWRAFAQGDKAVRITGLAFFLGLLVLCLPTRKIAHHVVVLYPVAALFVGQSLGAGLRFVLGQWRWAAAARWALAGAAGLAWLLVVVGQPVWIGAQKCLPTSGLSVHLAALPPDTDLLLVTPRQQWRNVAALAAERRIVAWQVPHWVAISTLQSAPAVAVVVEPASSPPPPGWHLVESTAEYSLWRKSEPPAE